MERLQNISTHLLSTNKLASHESPVSSSRSLNKLDWFKNNGWGYKDTEFVLDQDGIVRFSGNRYTICGKKLSAFRKWAEDFIGLDVTNVTPAQVKIEANPPIINEDFVNELRSNKTAYDEFTFEDGQRIHHSHGHTLQEIYVLRNGKFPRIVDTVIYVSSHEQVEQLVPLASRHNIVLIPYGGGTNVTQALMCEIKEKRMIVSLDTTRMNHVKWVDRKNMMACVESGILGQDLEKELNRYGLVCGHEPDSVEFSSLGGWISTRASGMKKNRYGNIDDILINVKIVTPTGTFTKKQDCPRVSSGPDLNEFILGSEGTIGVITEAVIKLRPMPKAKVFDSIIFHDFEIGIKFMNDVSNSKIWPASIRLIDNTQFQFGLALKTETESKIDEFFDKAKKYFVLNIKKFNPNKMAVVTILFEGSEEEIKYQQKSVYNIAKQHGGMRAGAENGKRGYFLTFVIAYLRDFAFKFQFIAESFETSTAWKNVSSLCKNVQLRIENECEKKGVVRKPFVSFRVTQLYDTGAAIYVYFGFLYKDLADPVQAYSDIEDAAREEILKNGGCISHHHGVGKLRKKFLKDSVGETGIHILKGVKKQVDPNNIFGNGNLFDI